MKQCIKPVTLTRIWYKIKPHAILSRTAKAQDLNYIQKYKFEI